MSAELLETEPTGPSVKRNRLTGTIVDSVNRAEGMIRDLLDASRIRAGKHIPFQMDYCDLHEIADRAVESLSLIHGNRFLLRTVQSITGYWNGDALRRVIENLGTNAVKYGSDTPVEISLETCGDTIKILVHNFGNPLTAEDQLKVFEPYTQIAKHAGKSTHGWGLGLTLVRGIAEAHGGKVYLESNAESGTTFTVEFPRDARFAQAA